MEITLIAEWQSFRSRFAQAPLPLRERGWGEGNRSHVDARAAAFPKPIEKRKASLIRPFGAPSPKKGAVVPRAGEGNGRSLGDCGSGSPETAPISLQRSRRIRLTEHTADNGNQVRPSLHYRLAIVRRQSTNRHPRHAKCGTLSQQVE
ncbi:hypothetical protein D9M71_694000 [compost metagenome]